MPISDAAIPTAQSPASRGRGGRRGTPPFSPERLRPSRAFRFSGSPPDRLGPTLGDRMLSWTTLPDSDIVSVVYNGGLTPAEIDGLRTELASTVAAHGAAKLLVEIGKDGGMPSKSLIDELSGEELLRKLGRSAVLTDKSLLRMMIAAGAKMAPIEVRVFKVAERDEAVAWLRA
ncbi:STAS/SEC14 domain-containing protein [Naasia lichenicola]|uniref:STAS/SEC14 domain-containing protein n=2 Tax=Naasia lichenicola TaxID=2565933 RepID=A0A4V3WTU4_9MICO|nr:STAS/SEC14 domain-containing protein [Naasia lichenicola]